MFIFCYVYSCYFYSGYFYYCYFLFWLFLFLLCLFLLFLFLFLCQSRGRDRGRGHHHYLHSLSLQIYKKKNKKEEIMWLSRPPAPTNNTYVEVAAKKTEAPLLWAPLGGGGYCTSSDNWPSQSPPTCAGLDSIHLVLISRVAPDVNIPMTEVMTWRGLGLQDFDHPG